MGEETQLGASIEELTNSLGDNTDAEPESPTPSADPEVSISQWVTPNEVAGWPDVRHVVNNPQVHIYTAVVDRSDTEAVKERLAAGNCTVRGTSRSVADSTVRVEFEESHCPF